MAPSRVVLPAPSEATLLTLPPLVLLAPSATFNPAALLRVTLLVELTVPVYPVIQFESPMLVPLSDPFACP